MPLICPESRGAGARPAEVARRSGLLSCSMVPTAAMISAPRRVLTAGMLVTISGVS